MQIKWGILGNAKIARNAMIPAFKKANHAELVGIASSSGTAKETAAVYEIPKYYDSYQGLLDDPEINAVYIPLPNHLHKEWVIKTAAAGKHVLCEKPAALNAEETKDMIDECASHNVLFMEAFMYQFHPQHEMVKKLISEGVIGNVNFMRAHFSAFVDKASSNFRLFKNMGGGSVYDVGCYCMHAFRNILNSEPVEIFARSQPDAELKIDMTTTVSMLMENGIQAVFDCSFEQQYREKYEVVGEKGTIEVLYPFRPDLHGTAIINVMDEEGNITEYRVEGDQYVLQVEHFSNCILTGQIPQYTVDNSINNMKAIDAVYRSIEEKKQVNL